ncbi:hypothetical protein NBRC116602_03270 [Hyphomicrobiales bacterium 4NK60-0047b]
MSDQSFVIAFPYISATELLQASETIISYLNERYIIFDQPSHCVLSQEKLGYGPGEKFLEATILEEERADVINCNFIEFSSKLQVNGLEVFMDRQCVVTASGDWQFMQCPSCLEQCSYSDGLSISLDNWLARTGCEMLACEVYYVPSPVHHWSFYNDMVLGNLIL